MPTEEPVGCARPTGGVVGEEAASATAEVPVGMLEKGGTAMIAVGKRPRISRPRRISGESSSR
jgi:hypothetical protein